MYCRPIESRTICWYTLESSRFSCTREPLLNGKVQYGWPPCSNYHRSARLYIFKAVASVGIPWKVLSLFAPGNPCWREGLVRLTSMYNQHWSAHLYIFKAASVGIPWKIVGRVAPGNPYWMGRFSTVDFGTQLTGLGTRGFRVWSPPVPFRTPK